MSDQVTVAVNIGDLAWLKTKLKELGEPMVPYKVDPLEFCQEAHKVKDGICIEIISRFKPYFDTGENKQ